MNFQFRSTSTQNPSSNFTFSYFQPHIIAPQLTVGHLTQQFSLKENILLAKSSVGYFRNLQLHVNVFDDPPTASYRPFGHLTLATDKGYMMLKENHVQQSLVDLNIDYSHITY